MRAFQELFEDWDDTVTYAGGTVILSEHAAADVVFVVLGGELELSLRGVSLGRVTEGGIIGEMAVLGTSSGNPTATAVSDVRLARLSRDQFSRMISNHPEFSLHALAAMAKRLRAMNAFVGAHLESRE